MKKRVVVTVSGGVAYVTVNDPEIEVLTIDYDIEGEGEPVQLDGENCLVYHGKEIKPKVVNRLFETLGY